MGTQVVSPGRNEIVENIEPRLSLQSFNDLNPSTVPLGTRLALPILRPAAGAVEQTLGTHRHRTYTTGKAQIALIARLAALGPYARAFGDSDEACIYTGKNRGIRVHFREKLYTCPARKRDHGIGLFDMVSKQSQEFPVTLALDCSSRGLEGYVLLTGCQLQPSGQDSGLLLSSRETDCHTGSTACYKHLGITTDHVFDFTKLFRFGDDHINLPGTETGERKLVIRLTKTRVCVKESLNGKMVSEPSCGAGFPACLIQD